MRNATQLVARMRNVEVLSLSVNRCGAAARGTAVCRTPRVIVAILAAR
jgi:hypothetical protein